MKRQQSDPKNSIVCRNKAAAHKFELLERLECGIILQGSEVKSLREKGASLDESYVRIENDELWIIKLNISYYSHGSIGHDPIRQRKLLARSREIRKLKPKVEQRGLTLVPLKIYFNERGLAKVTVALAKGKSQADKRQFLRAREDHREMQRASRRKRH